MRYMDVLGIAFQGNIHTPLNLPSSLPPCENPGLLFWNSIRKDFNDKGEVKNHVHTYR